MTNAESDKLPAFTFVDDEGRAKVKKSKTESKFRPYDKVCFRDSSANAKEGTCTVTSVPETGRYTLTNQDGQPVNNGAVVEEKDLVKA